MEVNPCAKINLGLNVVSKRSDGYHNLETVFYPVRLYDQLTVEPLPLDHVGQSSCQLTVDGLDILGDVQDNLVVKAYHLLNEHRPLPPVKVHLSKRIPTQAGMGGGSADCAYMLTALNTLFSLGLSKAELMHLAAQLGADCAFFIEPQPAYAEGIGNQLQPLPLNIDSYYMAIVKPPVAVSTKEAFANIQVHCPEKNCKDIVLQPIETWRNELINDFELSVIPQYPVIGQIKQQLYGLGAVYAAMSGSGSALFALFSNEPCQLQKTFSDCATYVIPPVKR